ncbi:hypothetical protein H4Q26_000394 [Puccinia striiformis f. sp. tritici PST-130]|nr:hypothetical protein H4Q26_000394 [Puccinia striiformis f. sp. tritici PST-130]
MTRVACVSTLSSEATIPRLGQHADRLQNIVSMALLAQDHHPPPGTRFDLMTITLPPIGNGTEIEIMIEGGTVVIERLAQIVTAASSKTERRIKIVIVPIVVSIIIMKIDLIVREGGVEVEVGNGKDGVEGVASLRMVQMNARIVTVGEITHLLANQASELQPQSTDINRLNLPIQLISHLHPHRRYPKTHPPAVPLNTIAPENDHTKPTLDSSTPGSAVAKARANAEAREGRLPGETLEQQKLRMKRERLEQWKAKKALEENNNNNSSSNTSTPLPQTTITTKSEHNIQKTPLAADEATAAALAAAAISARLGTNSTPIPAPSKLMKNATPIGIKGLPTKPSFNPFPDPSSNTTKLSSALGTEDDNSHTKIQKLTFEAINADDDLLKLVDAEEDSDEEDLVDGGHVGYNKRKIIDGVEEETGVIVAGSDEVDQQEGENESKIRLSQAVEKNTKKRFEAVSNIESSISQSNNTTTISQVKMEIDDQKITKVNDSDKKKLNQLNAGNKKLTDLDEDHPNDEDDQPAPSEDEIDKTNLRPEDIMALAAKKLKKKDLAPVDHQKITYEPFRSAFYHPPAEVEEMTEEEAENIRIAMDGIKIRGQDCPKPVMKWSWFGLHAACLEVIKTLGYQSPSPIQGQAVPAIMSGRDVIGVAKTGSGKDVGILTHVSTH